MSKEIMIEELRTRYIESYFEDSLLGNTLSFIEDLQQRIDKAIEYIEKVEPNYKDLHSEVLQSEYISNYGACELLEILKGGNND